MIIHKPTGKAYKNRLDAKIQMGGEATYTKAFKNNEFIFIDNNK